MISSTLGLGMHLIYSSYQGVRAVGRVLGYVLPYSNMALQGKIDFNTKHLKKGDPLPPFTGKLRLYNMRFCPYAQRAILALNAKNLDYEVINIDLVNKPEWLTSKSPLGKVPAIEIKEGETIFESLVIVEYLDEIYPQRPLLPKDPVKKAFDKIIIEVFGSTVLPFFVKFVYAPEKITEDNVTAYHRGLTFVQAQLVARGTTFLDGEEPGFADYMIWPWFERLHVFTKDDITKITAPKYAALASYIQHMLKDPVVSQYDIADIHNEFLASIRAGNPDYEILNKE